MTRKRSFLSALLDRVAPPEGLILDILAVVVGGSTGFAAVYFIKLIAFIQNFFYSSPQNFLPDIGLFLYFLVPVIGALLVGPIITWFASEAKGHGVPEVMQALVMRGGKIRPRVAIAKIFTAAICIGTGGAAGREGPIVQVGSALGSSIGQMLKLSDERIKNLVSCGAAAGIAATFNAPIAGVAFAIEVLNSELQTRMFGNVVIAAVSSSIISQMFLGDAPAFLLPSYGMVAPVSIILFFLLGIVAGFVGVVFIRVLDRVETGFDSWHFPLALKPAVGAVFLGMMGMIFMYYSDNMIDLGAEAHGNTEQSGQIPYFYGSGFSIIEAALQGRLSFWILLLLVFCKPLATSFTLGSGNSGGVFAPSLFIGAMLGGAMGNLFNVYFPAIAGPSGSYALVGMAALFAAVARAPLTSMLIVFEMSNDYSMILPLMVSSVTASYFAQWLYAESIYTVRLTRRGIRFEHGRDMDIMQGVLVKEVMNRKPVVVSRYDSLESLEEKFKTTNFLGFPVLDKRNRLWGIVTLQDINRLLSHEKFLRVEDIAVTTLVTVYEDEPIWTAIQKMASRDLARLPVVHREKKHELLGLISRSEILRAYEVAIVRKQRGQMLDRDISVRQQKENEFMEFQLHYGDWSVGKPLKDLALPETVNVVSVKRGNEDIIPKGKTCFAIGDVITVYGKKRSMDKVKKVFAGSGRS